ncbi:MAG: hypothetical protein EBT13_06065 [Rhodobacteraceae bacterium]|nr:hypothetical protein [Paracoccaceae bacterium]
MTALSEYERLESEGLWRADPDDQRRDVVVSFGDATLVIADSAGRPLTHWSLPAIHRVNPGTRPAIFAPDVEATETLEIEDDLMIGALEKVRKTIARHRPRQGRLRLFVTLGFAGILLAGSIFWLPGALREQALKVVPPVKRAEIGASLLGHVQRLTGTSCRNPLGSQALVKLKDRVLGPQSTGQIVVMPEGIGGGVALPGGIILVGRGLVENYEDPAVVSGFILAAATQSDTQDPLGRVLDGSGIMATLQLLTTGEIPSPTLRAFAETLVTKPSARPDTEILLGKFAAMNLPSTPYAYALDPTGANTLDLIEADPLSGRIVPPILTDGDWVALQGICNG